MEVWKSGVITTWGEPLFGPLPLQPNSNATRHMHQNSFRKYVGGEVWIGDAVRTMDFHLLNILFQWLSLSLFHFSCS
jgi:hypothetical protein